MGEDTHDTPGQTNKPTPQARARMGEKTCAGELVDAGKLAGGIGFLVGAVESAWKLSPAGGITNTLKESFGRSFKRSATLGGLMCAYTATKCTLRAARMEDDEYNNAGAAAIVFGGVGLLRNRPAQAMGGAFFSFIFVGLAAHYNWTMMPHRTQEKAFMYRIKQEAD